MLAFISLGRIGQGFIIYTIQSFFVIGRVVTGHVVIGQVMFGHVVIGHVVIGHVVIGHVVIGQVPAVSVPVLPRAYPFALLAAQPVSARRLAPGRRLTWETLSLVYDQDR
jgi:hypothetical protein